MRNLIHPNIDFKANENQYVFHWAIGVGKGMFEICASQIL